MSSISIPQTLPELQALRQEVEVRIAALIGGGAVVAKTKGRQPKAPKEKRDSGPSAWGDWSKKVFAEQKAEIEAFKAASEVKQGAHLKWLGNGGEKKGVMEEPGPGSERFGSKSAAWLAFKAEWDVAHPKDAKEEASASPEVSEAEEAPKKRRGPKKIADMTPEELAARAAKKALNGAKKAEEEEVARAAAPIGRVGGSGIAPAPAVAFEEESKEEEEQESVDLLPFVLDGTRYVRMGNMDDKKAITWASGDLWFFKKAAENNQGDYVGCLGEDGIIDSNAEEPSI